MSKQIEAQLREKLSKVNSRISAACARVGRSPDEIKLVAVTKYTPLELVQEFIEIEQASLGENRPQQLIQRSQELSETVRWHLIGQLQRNKVRAVLPFVELIHSIDSLKLLAHVDRVAGEQNLKPKILLQVNISGEESKSGFTPKEVHQAWDEISSFQNVEFSGLMTMAPASDSEALIRDSFRGLRKLRDQLNEQTEAFQLTELSMGMSSDFEIAIEEGATIIRLGSVLFTGRESLQ